MKSLLSSAVLPFGQGPKVILLENPKGWPLEEPPMHPHGVFSNRKGDEVTHQLCQWKQVNTKVEETAQERRGNRRVTSYTQPGGLTATLQFWFPLHICCKVAKFTNAHNPTVRRQGKEDKELLYFQQLICYAYITFSLSDVPRFWKKTAYRRITRVL